jgi:DNA-binding FadR family transcriptional regulator
MEIFKKAKQNRVFDDVVDQVEGAIIAGRLHEGAKLPPERSLQEIFGVSRGTLREALRVLEHRGLLRIQTGTKGGAFVESLSTDQISDSLGLLIRYRKVSLKDLGEFREVVEGVVAALAVERANEEEIGYLKQPLSQITDFI